MKGRHLGERHGCRLSSRQKDLFADAGHLNNAVFVSKGIPDVKVTGDAFFFMFFGGCCEKKHEK
ncbi:hypothetical protein CAY57_09395 [Heyndrickxia coagulans]|nr:hypothetical protein CAY57_09395 [Heyndrickxia coagulans]